MSLALYPSDAATAAPSDSPALRPAQPAPTLVEGQGCCQDKEEANLSKLGMRPHPTLGKASQKIYSPMPK